MVIANVLFDNNGNFLWVSITAIAAVIAIFINTYIAYRTTNANFKANVVAKSRIEWIQEVRKKVRILLLHVMTYLKSKIYMTNKKIKIQKL